MFIICDQNDIVQDIATEEANLSRGYTFPGYRLWMDIDLEDIRIEDTYKDGQLTHNVTSRMQNRQRGIDETKITKKIRQIAIDGLKITGDLPADFEN